MSALEVMSSDEWDIVKAALIRRINGVRSISSFPNVRQADLALETAGDVIDIVVDALDAAGLLATEQEWAVKHSQGTRPEPSERSATEWAESNNARNAHRYDFEAKHQCRVVSRRVTPWREAPK